jgi:hypothetical protein
MTACAARASLEAGPGDFVDRHGRDFRGGSPTSAA